MRRTGLLFLIGILMCPPALAQGGRDVPSGRPSREPGGLDLPSRGKQEPEPQPETEPAPAEEFASAYWGETKDRVELIFVACEKADAEGGARKVAETV